MVNESLMYLRKHKNMSLETDFEEVREEPNFDELSQNVATDELLMLIQELPIGYRTVFNLYAIEGYKHDEVGKLLGISTGTSKSQLNRARKLLQKQLVEMENDASIMRGVN